MANILVVEDQKLLRKMLCSELQEHSYNTIEAEDGMEGLNMVENEDVSLIISDLVMPNFDGVDFFELLSSCHPEIKVLCLTSIPEGHTIHQKASQIIGKDNILQKTGSMDAIIEKVKSILA